MIDCPCFVDFRGYIPPFFLHLSVFCFFGVVSAYYWIVIASINILCDVMICFDMLVYCCYIP